MFIFVMYKKIRKMEAKSFIYTRKIHETENAEDYVELIGDLIESEGEARVVDVAKHLGISKATVNQTINRLIKKGLVASKPYRSIHLTNIGKQIARKTRERHNIVYNFLISLGVNKKIAEQESEGIEHHVGEKTLSLFKKFAKKMEKKK